MCKSKNSNLRVGKSSAFPKYTNIVKTIRIFRTVHIFTIKKVIFKNRFWKTQAFWNRNNLKYIKCRGNFEEKIFNYEHK